jgi:hypothetical protein
MSVFDDDDDVDAVVQDFDKLTPTLEREMSLVQKATWKYAFYSVTGHDGHEQSVKDLTQFWGADIAKAAKTPLVSMGRVSSPEQEVLFYEVHTVLRTTLTVSGRTSARHRHEKNAPKEIPVISLLILMTRFLRMKTSPPQRLKRSRRMGLRRQRILRMRRWGTYFRVRWRIGHACEVPNSCQ